MYIYIYIYIYKYKGEILKDLFLFFLWIINIWIEFYIYIYIYYSRSLNRTFFNCFTFFDIEGSPGRGREPPGTSAWFLKARLDILTGMIFIISKEGSEDTTDISLRTDTSYQGQKSEKAPPNLLPCDDVISRHNRFDGKTLIFYIYSKIIL